MDIRTIDESKIRSYVTKARPVEKSNTILEIEIDGKLFRCERPHYFHKKFDIAVSKEAFEREGQLIYGKTIPVFFDQKGRWWCAEEFSSKGMMAFFIENPEKYIEVIKNKVKDVKELIKIAKELENTIYSNDKKVIAENLKKLDHIFKIFYSYHFITYILFDELVYEFRELLNKYLPKKLANIYICEFLYAEITKEAIKVGAINEKRGQRDTTYSDDKPIVFYREPKIHFESKYDQEVLDTFVKNGASEEEIKKLKALRIITPVSIQISEEGQYLESKTFCAMMSLVVNKIAQILVDYVVIEDKDKVKDYDTEELVKILLDIVNDKHRDYDPYIRSLCNSIGNMEIGTLQPFDWFQMHPLYAKEYLARVKEFIKKAEEKGLSTKELAYCFDSVSALRVFNSYSILDMKAIRMPKEERMKISDFIFEMVKERMKGEDVFAFKSNIIRNQDEVKELVKEKKLVNANPSMAKLLGKIFNTLYNLGAATNLDIYLDYSIEPEGPYDVSEIFGEGRFLVLRRFMDLQIPEIWEERKGLKPNNVNIYTVYNHNVKFRSEYIAAHTHFEGDTINNMEHFIVEVDGKLISSEEELKEILSITEKQAVEQWKKVMKMDSEEHKLKGLYARMIPLKKLFAKVGMDWKPTKKMIEAVKGKSYMTNDFWNLPDNNEGKAEFNRRIQDPRDDFFAGDSL